MSHCLIILLLSIENRKDVIKEIDNVLSLDIVLYIKRVLPMMKSWRSLVIADTNYSEDIEVKSLGLIAEPCGGATASWIWARESWRAGQICRAIEMY